MLRAFLFNDTFADFCCDKVMPSLHLCNFPGPMQYFEAEKNITQYCEKNWAKMNGLKPKLRLVK
jgi:hypothetical protein